VSAPVSAETIEKAARALYMQGRTEWSYDRWAIANPATQEECRNDAVVIVAAVRDDLVAEALAPIRALAEEMTRGPQPTNLYNDGYREGHHDARVEFGRRLAALSDPVVATEPSAS
jgi:hypothetical protein